MNILLIVIGAYLFCGVIAIVLLDIKTGKVRGRLKTASIDTQLLTGDSQKVALVATVIALWVFWPFAIYAALFQGGK